MNKKSLHLSILSIILLVIWILLYWIFRYNVYQYNKEVEQVNKMLSFEQMVLKHKEYLQERKNLFPNDDFSINYEYFTNSWKFTRFDAKECWLSDEQYDMYLDTTFKRGSDLTDNCFYESIHPTHINWYQS